MYGTVPLLHINRAIILG